MQTRPRHYIEVSVIHDSRKDAASATLQLEGTRIKVTRVTESGNHIYELKFPQTIVAIERNTRDGIVGLIHPQDRPIIQSEIARTTAEVHPDKSSEQRKDLRRKMFEVINTLPRLKVVGIKSRNGSGEYRTIGIHELG